MADKWQHLDWNPGSGVGGVFLYNHNLSNALHPPSGPAYLGGNPQDYFHFFLFFKNNLFILFLAAVGLHCCTRAFSSCSERGLLFVVVRGLLTVVASLVVEHGL